MLEFFEKNLGFFIVVAIVGSFVIYSVRKERKEEEKKGQEKKRQEQEKNKQGKGV